MKADKPCCPAGAARRIKRIVVNGRAVGIAFLDEIAEKVSSLGLSEGTEIAKALMKEVKLYNYVPTDKENDYQAALMDWYHHRK